MSNLNFTAMERYTKEQVEEQQLRFDNFMKSANLHKIGGRWLWFTMNDAGDGRYNPYVYAHRVLRLCAKVCGSMYHPEVLRDAGSSINAFYGEILVQKALVTFLDAPQELVKQSSS